MLANQIQSLEDYKKIKDKLCNREILYEEIITEISDELGFKYFKAIYMPERLKVKVSTKVQIDYFLNSFFDMTNMYSVEEKNAFYVIAQFTYAREKNEELKRANDSDDESFEYDEYNSRMDNFESEFNELIKAKNSDGYIANRELIESGQAIALAFKLIDTGAINGEYLNYFCETLDDYIIYISHTEFYNSTPGEWLRELYGKNEDPISFELPKTK